MPNIRPTIRFFLGLVALLGGYFAARRASDQVHMMVIFNFNLALLIYATIKSKIGDENSSAWWFGFALFGWVWFLGQLVDPQGVLLPKLIEGRLSSIAFQQVRPETLADPNDGSMQGLLTAQADIRRTNERMLLVQGIVHEMLIIPVPLLGGWLVSRLARRRGSVLVCREG